MQKAVSPLAWMFIFLALGLGFAFGWFAPSIGHDQTPPDEKGLSVAELDQYRADLERARDETALLRAELAAGKAGSAAEAPETTSNPASPVPDTMPDEKREAAKKLLPDLEYRLSADPTNPTLLADYIETAATAGEHDRAIERIKAMVAKHPDNPDLLTFLGRAYLAKVNAVKLSIKQGQLAFAAIGEFSKALEKDESHFDARWYRGVMNYYMPEFLNKTGESIKDLETLVEQGGGGAGDDRYARVYRMLGAAYRKADRVEDAKKTWERGHELFPADEALKKAASGGK